MYYAVRASAPSLHRESDSFHTHDHAFKTNLQFVYIIYTSSKFIYSTALPGWHTHKQNKYTKTLQLEISFELVRG